MHEVCVALLHRAAVSTPLGSGALRSKLGSSSTRLRDGPGNELTPADAHTRRGCTGAGLVAGGTAWQVQHVGGRAIPGWLNAGFSQHRLPELQVQVREVPAQVPKPGSGQWQRSPEHHRAVLQACQVRYAQRLQPSPNTRPRPHNRINRAGDVLSGSCTSGYPVNRFSRRAMVLCALVLHPQMAPACRAGPCPS